MWFFPEKTEEALGRCRVDGDGDLLGDWAMW